MSLVLLQPCCTLLLLLGLCLQGHRVLLPLHPGGLLEESARQRWGPDTTPVGQPRFRFQVMPLTQGEKPVSVDTRLPRGPRACHSSSSSGRNQAGPSGLLRAAAHHTQHSLPASETVFPSILFHCCYKIKYNSFHFYIVSKCMPFCVSIFLEI